MNLILIYISVLWNAIDFYGILLAHSWCTGVHV